MSGGVVVDLVHRKRLRPVIEVARRELADLEPDQVPHRLRKVAASSARVLPPPLEKTMMEVLVADADFRDRVRDRWEGTGQGDAIGSAFLADPEATLSSMDVEGEPDRDLGKEIEALERELASARDAMAEAKRRIAELRHKATTDLANARASDKASRAGLEAAAATARREADEQRATASERQIEAVALRSEVSELRSVIERFHAKEQRRSEVAERAMSGSSRWSPPPSPSDLAAWLDAAERSMRPYRDRSLRHPDQQEDPELRLPKGVAPDHAKAIDAIIDLEPRIIIIDGYNVGGAIGRDFASRSGRDRVLVLANSLARASTAQIHVVFDAVGREGRGTISADLGVSVSFATDVSADDRIVDIVAERPGSVVITNDRELRERCGSLGALTVWADALVSWAANP
jgi:hypothetical protein